MARMKMRVRLLEESDHDDKKTSQISHSANSAERSSLENNRTTTFTLSRRIGSTNYRVNAYFSEKAAETLEDKICRMIQNEVLENAPECGTILLSQTGRQSERSAI